MRDYFLKQHHYYQLYFCECIADVSKLLDGSAAQYSWATF